MSHAPQFIQSAVYPDVHVPMMTPEQFEHLNDFVNMVTLTGEITTELLSDPIYD